MWTYFKNDPYVLPCWGLIDWLIVLRPAQEYFTYIWRCHHYRRRAAKFRRMLGTQGLWAGRDLYRATPAVTQGPRFFQSHPKDRPIQSPLNTRGDGENLFWPGYTHGSPFSRLLWHTREYGGPILTLILTGSFWRTIVIWFKEWIYFFVCGWKYPSGKKMTGNCIIARSAWC
jgi:hypothetical protein